VPGGARAYPSVGPSPGHLESLSAPRWVSQGRGHPRDVLRPDNMDTFGTCWEEREPARVLGQRSDHADGLGEGT
jgi:hypothetical protein